MCKVASNQTGGSRLACSSYPANTRQCISCKHQQCKHTSSANTPAVQAHQQCKHTSSANTGADLAQAVPTFDRERLPDAHGLVDIESSFSKLVGNKVKAVLDLKFLKIVTHVVFGKRLEQSACSTTTVHFLVIG